MLSHLVEESNRLKMQVDQHFKQKSKWLQHAKLSLEEDELVKRSNSVNIIFFH